MTQPTVEDIQYVEAHFSHVCNNTIPASWTARVKAHIGKSSLTINYRGDNPQELIERISKEYDNLIIAPHVMMLLKEENGKNQKRRT